MYVFVYMYVCMHVCMYACVCMYVYVYFYIYVYVYVSVSVCMCVCVYVCVCVCMYVCMCMHVYACRYTCTNWYSLRSRAHACISRTACFGAAVIRWNYNGCYQHMNLDQCGNRLNEVARSSGFPLEMDTSLF